MPDLDPPKEVTAVGGVGQVTIDWSPVDGAAGYLMADLAERTQLVSVPLEWNGSAVEVTLPMPAAVLLELRPPRV